MDGALQNGELVSLFERNLCDITPDGSVGLTVVRLVWAEQKFQALHGRYGALVEMTNMLDGLPPETTSGQLGSYTISIELVSALQTLSVANYKGCAYFTTTDNQPQIYDLHPVGLLGIETKPRDMKISWGFAQMEKRLEGSLASFPRT